MPRFKCTALFELATNTSGQQVGRRIAGWSESLYDSASFAQTQRDFRVLCQKRAAMLPIGARIVGQRYQEVDPVGSSQTDANQYPGQLQNTCDLPQVSILTSIGTSSAPNVRRMMLRGIPDDAVREGEYRPIPGFDDALIAYGRELQGFYFYARTLNAPQATIDHIEANGAGVLESDVVLTPGMYVRILRSINADGRRVGGRFRVVTGPTPQTFTLQGWPYGDCTKGKLRVDQVSFLQMSGASFRIVRAVVRKAGRPFGQFSGKVSTRR